MAQYSSSREINQNSYLLFKRVNIPGKKKDKVVSFMVFEMKLKVFWDDLVVGMYSLRWDIISVILVEYNVFGDTTWRFLRLLCEFFHFGDDFSAFRATSSDFAENFPASC